MTESNKLFAKPPTIYPKRVWGNYRKLKWLSMTILFLIYYISPFLRYDRGENAPNQAILIDLPARRAYFFGIEIWPHEVYYLAGMFILAAIGLFAVSAILGRVWCGYACPQTVWTDLFIWVERIVQGDRNARMKLDKSKLSFEKIWKKGLTHFIWIIIGIFTAGAWVLYFNDAPTLLRDILDYKISFNVAVWIAGLTFSTYVMAGFAREQVCSLMCPYARFQSAMFDKDTLVISYDKDRGEPRSNFKAGEERTGKGDCIDCGNCVTVCPTGIDIRNGLQMECIACGLCVDACNNVMDKVGMPRGLIRYDTESNQEARTIARSKSQIFKDRIRIIRPRTIYYLIIISAVSGVILYGLLTRPSIDIVLIHDRNPLFVKLSDGSIRNNYTLKIMNMSNHDKDYSLEISGIDNPKVKIEGAGTLDKEKLPVSHDSEAEYRIMISSKESLKNKNDVKFIIKDNKTGEFATRKSPFMTGN
ncbi:MAG: cytochrome c oxidase accessory protein CcoG [Pseudomonadota bacterium]